MSDGHTFWVVYTYARDTERNHKKKLPFERENSSNKFPVVMEVREAIYSDFRFLHKSVGWT